MIQKDENILEILRLPYHSLCKVYVQTPLKKVVHEILAQIRTGDISSINVNEIIEKAERIPTREDFRKAVIRKLEHHMIYDQSDSQGRESFLDEIHSHPSPKEFLTILIDSLRKFNSEERNNFYSNLSLDLFMGGINRIYTQGISENYANTMIPFLVTENSDKFTEMMEESSTTCAQKSYEYIRSYLQHMSHFAQHYTMEQQIILYRYESIKQLYSII